MGGKAIGLHEAARIHQRVDALARRELARTVLFFDSLWPAGCERDLIFGLELSQQLAVAIRHGARLKHCFEQDRK